MIIIQYQTPPEETLYSYLTKNLMKVGLEHKNLSVPIVFGHALFSEGISEMGQERNFPKIGIEWTQDRHLDPTFSRNHVIKKMDDELRTKIISYRNFLEESRRVSSDEAIQSIIESEFVEKWDYQVESEIIISGYATGGAGRRAIRWIFEAVNGVLYPTLMDISNECKVSCKMPDAMDVNLMIELYGMTAWGFEFPVKISQLKTIYRGKDIFSEPAKNVFPDNSQGSINNNNGENNSGNSNNNNTGGSTNGNTGGNTGITPTTPIVPPSKSKYKVKLGGLETYGIKGEDK